MGTPSLREYLALEPLATGDRKRPTCEADLKKLLDDNAAVEPLLQSELRRIRDGVEASSNSAKEVSKTVMESMEKLEKYCQDRNSRPHPPVPEPRRSSASERPAAGTEAEPRRSKREKRTTYQDGNWVK